SHVSLRDQEARLVTSEADARKLLDAAGALTADVERHLGGELVRPIAEESPEWPPIAFDLTEAWTVILRKEQRDFAASRRDFETTLRDIATRTRGARDGLVRDLHDRAEMREQVHEQIAWA